MKVNEAIRKVGENIKVVSIEETFNGDYRFYEFVRNGKGFEISYKTQYEELKAALDKKARNLTVKSIEEVPNIYGEVHMVRIHAYERWSSRR